MLRQGPSSVQGDSEFSLAFPANGEATCRGSSVCRRVLCHCVLTENLGMTVLTGKETDMKVRKERGRRGTLVDNLQICLQVILQCSSSQLGARVVPALRG